MAVLALAYLLLFRACIGAHRRALERERDGVVLSHALKDLLHDLQQHRGACNLFLSGDGGFAGKVEALQQAVNGRVRALDGRMAGQVPPAWSRFTQGWQGLAHDVRRLDTGESFIRHTRLIQQLLELLDEVGELTGLVTDEQGEAKQLADALIHRVPVVTELLGQLRALGSSAAAQGRVSSVTAMRLQFLSVQVRESLQPVGVAVERVAASQRNERLCSEYRGTAGCIDGFLQTVDQELIGCQHVAIVPDAYFKQATQVIDANYRLFDIMQPELAGLLDRRQGVSRRRMNAMTLSIFVLMGLCLSVAAMI